MRARGRPVRRAPSPAIGPPLSEEFPLAEWERMVAKHGAETREVRYRLSKTHYAWLNDRNFWQILQET